MEISEIIDQAMKQAQEIANSYTYPVFVSDAKNKPDLIGSSVIIKLNDRYYSITASHVLTNVLDSGSQFIIGIDGKYVSIIGEFVYSSHDSKDHFDIAFIELSSNFVKKNNILYLQQSKLLLDQHQVHIAFIHGFPCSKNKQTKALLGTKKFKLKAYSYAGVIKSDFYDWEKLGKIESIHTCMTYRKTSNMNTPTNPRGISGGGLWLVPNLHEATEIYLDSILIEYHESYKVTFSTKIRHIVEFIREHDLMGQQA